MNANDAQAIHIFTELFDAAAAAGQITESVLLTRADGETVMDAALLNVMEQYQKHHYLMRAYHKIRHGDGDGRVSYGFKTISDTEKVYHARWDMPDEEGEVYYAAVLVRYNTKTEVFTAAVEWEMVRHEQEEEEPELTQEELLEVRAKCVEMIGKIVALGPDGLARLPIKKQEELAALAAVMREFWGQIMDK